MLKRRTSTVNILLILLLNTSPHLNDSKHATHNGCIFPILHIDWFEIKPKIVFIIIPKI